MRVVDQVFFNLKQTKQLDKHGTIKFSNKHERYLH
jgi:uncharacterized protein YlbG (UPF0298 family)